MGRRGWLIVVAALLVAGCSDRGGSSSSSPTSFAPFTPPEVTAPRTMASRSVVEPDSVAGIPLGASKDQAAAVLGNATTTSTGRDSAGAYETLHWQLSGSRGLALSFRAGSRFSPGLTDWRTDIRGPATSAGIEVGNDADKVIAAYGPLADLCCASKAATVERGGGRLAVIVQNNTRIVQRIVGGDPNVWLRTIAD